jgi:hypothetical protein
VKNEQQPYSTAIYGQPSFEAEFLVISMSFDFSADTCKQILTFSISILALTVTFAKDTFLKDRKIYQRSGQLRCSDSLL